MYVFIYLCHVLRVTFMLVHTGCFIFKIHVRRAAGRGYSYFHLCLIVYVCPDLNDKLHYGLQKTLCLGWNHVMKYVKM